MESFVIVSIAVVVLGVFGIIFLNSVKIVEKTDAPPEELSKSAAARERVYGEGRLKRFGDVTTEQMPRAEKLWDRSKERIEEIVASATDKGIRVEESELGLEMEGKSDRLLLYVDATGPDPVFLVWTEDLRTDESSDLQRIRQVRKMAEVVDAWIAKK